MCVRYVLCAITLKRGAQSLFSIIVYSKLHKLQKIKLGGSHSCLLKCSLSEHFQAVPAKEVTKSKSRVPDNTWHATDWAD